MATSEHEKMHPVIIGGVADSAGIDQSTLTNTVQSGSALPAETYLLKCSGYFHFSNCHFLGQNFVMPPPFSMGVHIVSLLSVSP